MTAASLYARGEYLAAHEAWEDEWRVSRSPRLRGLCQLAAAAVQAQRGRWRGVRTLAARAGANLGGALGDEVRAWGERVANAGAWHSPPEVHLDMAAPLTAQDLLPLVVKLPHDEQVRLARLALDEAQRSGGGDAEAYRRSPPSFDEFGTEEEPMAWEGEGWEEFYAPR